MEKYIVKREFADKFNKAGCFKAGEVLPADFISSDRIGYAVSQGLIEKIATEKALPAKKDEK
ncbi:MAG: hypothetical protein LBS01_02355 [Prevotellaceae bacterium]|jgi:hypothetical protein|nr:hypothetical protein [Prevotellaceae bacterium]